MLRACASLSITHGPAIRNRGLPPPRRKESKLISFRAVMSDFEDSTEAGSVAKAGAPPRVSRHCGEDVTKLCCGRYSWTPLMIWRITPRLGGGARGSPQGRCEFRLAHGSGGAGVSFFFL